MVLSLEQNYGPHSQHRFDVDDCFSTPPPICWIWLLRPTSSSGVWRRCWLVLSWLWRASWRSGKRLAETSAWTSSPLPSGGSWTAATSASSSTMNNQEIFRNRHPANYNYSILFMFFNLIYVHIHHRWRRDCQLQNDTLLTHPKRKTNRLMPLLIPVKSRATLSLKGQFIIAIIWKNNWCMGREKVGVVLDLWARFAVSS